MSLQDLVNSMNEMGKAERGNYHLSLGKMINKLKNLPANALVFFSDGGSPDQLMSYRGYYSDLSFSSYEDDKDVSKVWEILQKCEEVLNKTLMGYKGGDFLMEARTPMWKAEYSCSPNTAIMGIELKDGIVYLTVIQLEY